MKPLAQRAFEEAAEGADAHIDEGGGFRQRNLFGVMLIDPGADFVNPCLVRQRQRWRKVVAPGTPPLSEAERERFRQGYAELKNTIRQRTDPRWQTVGAPPTAASVPQMANRAPSLLSRA